MFSFVTGGGRSISRPTANHRRSGRRNQRLQTVLRSEGVARTLNFSKIQHCKKIKIFESKHTRRLANSPRVETKTTRDINEKRSKNFLLNLEQQTVRLRVLLPAFIMEALLATYMDEMRREWASSYMSADSPLSLDGTSGSPSSSWLPWSSNWILHIKWWTLLFITYWEI